MSWMIAPPCATPSKKMVHHLTAPVRDLPVTAVVEVGVARPCVPFVNQFITAQSRLCGSESGRFACSKVSFGASTLATCSSTFPTRSTFGVS